MAAPRGRRSLLRRLLGAHGAALPFRPGVVRPSEANPPEVTAGSTRLSAQVDAALVRAVRTRAGRCRPGASVGDLAMILAICGICGIGAAALWFGAAVAAADNGAPPAATTTTDAPPPDPYAPPVRRKTPKPAVTHRAAPRVAPRSPSAPVSTPSPTIVRPAATPKAEPHVKTVRRHRTARRRPVVKAPPASAWLAPLAEVVRAGQAPLPATGNQDQRYLWLAGIALATLALAALSLHVLSVRYFGLSFE